MLYKTPCFHTKLSVIDYNYILEFSVKKYAKTLQNLRGTKIAFTSITTKTEELHIKSNTHTTLEVIL
jgi:hypothetical protein